MPVLCHLKQSIGANFTNLSMTNGAECVKAVTILTLYLAQFGTTTQTCLGG